MHANNNPDKFYDEIVMPYKGSLEELVCLQSKYRILFQFNWSNSMGCIEFEFWPCLGDF